MARKLLLLRQVDQKWGPQMNFILREKKVESEHTSADFFTKFVFKLGEYDGNNSLENVKKLTLEVSTPNQSIDDSLK